MRLKFCNPTIIQHSKNSNANSKYRFFFYVVLNSNQQEHVTQIKKPTESSDILNRLYKYV